MRTLKLQTSCFEPRDTGKVLDKQRSPAPRSSGSSATSSSSGEVFQKTTSTTSQRRQRRIQKLARQYLLELESSHLEVVLIPAPDPRHPTHMVRAVQEQNCRWYRELCEEHPSNGHSKKLKFQTKIKRNLVVKALKSLASMTAAARPDMLMTSYEAMLVEFMMRRENL